METLHSNLQYEHAAHACPADSTLEKGSIAGAPR